jgi:hypothetical protein
VITEKRCPSCGGIKSVTDFGRNRSLGDGLSFYCLACNRERNRAWYREHRRSLGKEVRDHSWIPEGFRWCPSCEQPVAHEDYTRNTRTASGFGSRCRACDRAANSAGYFYRTYKLRKSQVAEMRAAQDGRRAICGDPAQHLDHDHASGAMRQMLCQRCNHGLGSSGTTRVCCTRPPATSTLTASARSSPGSRRRPSAGLAPGARPGSRR